jgi:hypothetical protein
MVIDHVAILVPDAAETARQLRDHTGLGSERGAYLPRAGTRMHTVWLQPPLNTWSFTPSRTARRQKPPNRGASRSPVRLGASACSAGPSSSTTWKLCPTGGAMEPVCGGTPPGRRSGRRQRLTMAGLRPGVSRSTVDSRGVATPRAALACCGDGQSELRHAAPRRWMPDLGRA